MIGFIFDTKTITIDQNKMSQKRKVLRRKCNFFHKGRITLWFLDINLDIAGQLLVPFAACFLFEYLFPFTALPLLAFEPMYFMFILLLSIFYCFISARASLSDFLDVSNIFWIFLDVFVFAGILWWSKEIIYVQVKEDWVSFFLFFFGEILVIYVEFWVYIN